MKLWDVIIIGGGLAGSAASIELARAGKKVLLLEKEKQAHHKVCGEFISYEAAYYLALLGLDLKKLGAEKIENIFLIHEDKIARSALPFSAFSLSRLVLDESLLELAAQSGAEILRGANVEELTKVAEGWQVKQANGETALASSVFLASGKHNLRGYSREMPKEMLRETQSDLIGFKMHFKLKKTFKKNVEIILFDGGYAGLEPVENGIVNLCLVVKKSRFNDCNKDWDELLEYIAKASRYFAKLMEGAEACFLKPLAIFGIPYGFIYRDLNGQKGLYRLGDQMAVIPSFCGDGMAIALHTAHLAVRNYLQKDEMAYHAQARFELESQMKKAVRISRLISFSRGQRVIHLICRIFPRLLSVVAKRTRLEIFGNCK